MKRDNGETAEGLRAKPWLPFVIIIAASALAHLWCLGSQFYLDDISQIRDSEVIRSGRFWEIRLSSWTYLGYVVQSRLFGMSAVGFHAVNWLLHTAVACVLFAFGRDFLLGQWRAGVALFAALLFAVHPLASEIPNYARTQDLAWVTLFSLLAAWAMLRFVRDSGWRLGPAGPSEEIPVFRRSSRRWSWLAFCGVCIIGATFSKGPGLLHALMATGAVGLAFMPPELGNLLRRKRWLFPVAVAGLIAAMWLLGLFKSGLGILDQWSNPRFIGHAYTISRVFWEFAWRSVIPVALSSDHHIAETLVPAGAKFWNIPDKVAMLAAAGLVGLTVLSGFLAWRKSTRLFGVCLFLYVATILFRVFYLIPEFMPEYRIYPGLPWFCLGAAIALTAGWKWLFPTVTPAPRAVCLVALLAWLSAERSLLWHNLDRLMANVLEQYPAQARAIWELDDRDLAAENWQAVIDRQEQVWPEVRRKFIASLSELAPARELPSGHFSLAEVACTGRYAVAVAHAKSPAEGLQVIDGLEKYMQALRIDPATNPHHWGLFKRDKALVLETGGNYQAALDCLKREKDRPQLAPKDFERISKKLAATKPGP
ncbi:MAG: hypothetical protein V4819_09275 [Verrucomicrobiota bacterium]